MPLKLSSSTLLTKPEGGPGLQRAERLQLHHKSQMSRSFCPCQLLAWPSPACKTLCDPGDCVPYSHPAQLSVASPQLPQRGMKSWCS